MPENLSLITKEDVAKIILEGVPNHPGIAAEIFEALGDYSSDIEFITAQAVNNDIGNVIFTISASEIDRITNLLKPLQKKLSASDIKTDTNIAIISLHSSNNDSALTGKMFSGVFSTLAQVGINIDMINSSLFSISCVISKDQLENAIEALKKAFEIN